MLDGLYVALSSVEEDSIGLIHNRAALGKKEIVIKKLPKKADSFENIFNYADAYGKIRYGYYGSRYILDDETKYLNSAIGGIAGIKSAKYKGFGFNIATYISKDLDFLYDSSLKNSEFLTYDKKSYVYLGEASIDFKNRYISINFGRFAKDTPYFNTDDIRMSQNTFEGVFGEFDIDDSIKVDLYYIKRWAGFDSADENSSQSDFKDLVNNSKGLYGGGIVYSYGKENQASFWGYYVDRFAVLLYSETSGHLHYDDTHIDFGFEVAYNKELNDSGINGIVIGGMGIFHFGDFFVSIADDYAFVKSGDVITDGFGGGPYLTSLDEATIAAISDIKNKIVNETKDNINFLRTGIGYDVDSLNSSFEYAFGYASLGISDIKEHDFIYSYNLDDKISAQLIAIHYQTSQDELDRFLIRADYNF